MSGFQSRIFYRKEKLRGACWEYEIEGGWIAVPAPSGVRHLLQHRFAFYRPREVEVRTPRGVERLSRTRAEQWFFPDRWFSLLRFVTNDDRTVGYYVNFSRPLIELRTNYYRDIDLELDLWLDPDGTAIDLELDLWLDPDGTATELDRDEFEDEVAQKRLPSDWAVSVNAACQAVTEAAASTVAEVGPDLDRQRDPAHGIPAFILRA